MGAYRPIGPGAKPGKIRNTVGAPDPITNLLDAQHATLDNLAQLFGAVRGGMRREFRRRSAATRAAGSVGTILVLTLLGRRRPALGLIFSILRMTVGTGGVGSWERAMTRKRQSGFQ